MSRDAGSIPAASTVAGITTRLKVTGYTPHRDLGQTPRKNSCETDLPRRCVQKGSTTPKGSEPRHSMP